MQVIFYISLKNTKRQKVDKIVYLYGLKFEQK